MDPEPLIALWPLRVPVDGGESGLVTTLARPGVALGSVPLMRGRGKKLAGLRTGARRSPAQAAERRARATATRAPPRSRDGRSDSVGEE